MLPDKEKSKKLVKLLEQKRKIEEQKRKIEEQIRIEEDRIRMKIGKMTNDRRQRYQKMKQAYEMRQDGSTFVEISKKLNLSASQVSILCLRYSVLMDLMEKKNQT